MGHFYNDKCEACHTQVIKSGKNKGKERATRITDARKLGLFPSSTGIIGVLDKPFLVDWKARKVLAIAYDQPPQGESVEAWTAKIMQQHAEHQETQVQDRGSVLHAEIEDYFNSSRGEIVSTDYDFIAPVIEIVEAMDSPVASAERILVNAAEGYAGTADIILDSGQIVDFKTKDFKGKEEVKPSFENCMQLASYYVAANGHANFQPCTNIYIDRAVPGRVFVKQWTPEELATGWEAFLLCAGLWRILNKYDPRRND